MLRALSRLQAKDQRISEEKEEADLREHLQSGKDDLCDLDLSALGDEYSSVRTLRSGSILDVFVHRDACSFVKQKAAQMAKKSGSAVDACQRLWNQEHCLITDAEAPAQDSVPASAKLSHCCRCGGGRCICKGKGLICRLAAENLGKAICKRSPKNSKFRKMLKAGWVVVSIAHRWYHVGLQYWRPQRPTLLTMELLEGEVWGCRVLRPLYKPHGSRKLAVPITALKSFWDLDLTSTLEVSFWKLVVFDRSLPNWRPDRLLLIKPLGEFLDNAEPVVFWNGEAAELAAAEEKKRLQAAAAARARERRKAGGESRTAGARKPRAPPGPQVAAMRKRRAEVAQEAPLLPLPAPPLDSDGDRSDDSIDSTSLFGPWSSSDDEQRGSKLPKDEWSDEDLDISLATLTHEAVHDGKKPKGATAGDEDWDWLSEFDGLGDDELFADGGMPVFHVGKEGDQVDDRGSDASGDLDDLWASEGEADEKPPAKKRAGSTEDGVDKQPQNCGRTRRGPRATHDEDRSELQPAGCVCRVYRKPGEVPYWYGELPPGMHDTKGRHSRSRRFHEGLRTEAAALADVESWLHIHAEGAAAESETLEVLEDHASSTSSDSSSSGSSS